jgi:hypothetical protein
MCDYPGGYGPWFVALLFNPSDKSKKQTHLLPHTMPHLAIDALNKGHRGGNGHWLIMIKVGPFASWSQCVAYAHEWTVRTRGRGRRLERGVELYAQHGQPMGLTMWVQTRPLHEALAVRPTRALPPLPLPAVAKPVDNNDDSGDVFHGGSASIGSLRKAIKRL